MALKNAGPICASFMAITSALANRPSAIRESKLRRIRIGNPVSGKSGGSKTAIRRAFGSVSAASRAMIPPELTPNT